MTKRASAALLLFAVLALPLQAGFSSIARALDAEPGVTQIGIPFFSIARVFLRMVAPSGVHDLQFATFEGAGQLDPRRVQELVRKNVGGGFVPLVQVRSRKSNEWSFIYARPGRGDDRIELMFLANDSSETVLVRVEVDASVIAREIRAEPRTVTHVAGR